MIITRTPLRVSLLGGGSDYGSWLEKESGLVLGGAVDKYVYVTARELPPFHDFRHRVAYREVETVKSAGEIRHPAVRACLARAGWADAPGGPGLEITHLSDLPGRSGTGSSSSFVVGLLNALYALRGVYRAPARLAEEATAVEQRDLGESVGFQDQALAAHGGLNLLHFSPGGGVAVEPLGLTPAHRAELEDHLLLFFTRIPRTSSEVASTYAASLGERRLSMFALVRMAEEGAGAVRKKDWERLGWLVDQSWRVKAGLSGAVTSPEIDRLYAAARLAGAWGGKLTGAGGGGCLLLVAPPARHEAVAAALGSCVRVPFRFADGGSRVIFAEA
jgi:D-glycero-alpha-D-manno-heptose-7-phosphate kinase